MLTKEKTLHYDYSGVSPGDRKEEIMCGMDTGEIESLKERLERLEIKVDKIAEHLKIMLLYKPETFTVVKEEDMKKVLP